MRIYKTKNYDEMSRKAANIISAQMILKPESVLGLATGSSPIGTYKQLINWYKKGDLDFSQIHSINLDEYKGLDASNSESYAYFMRHNLFDHVNIKPENTYIPNGMEEDVDKEYKEMSELYKMDVNQIKQLLPAYQVRADLAQQKALELIKTSVK